MVSSTETRLLELQTELWKARAQAKQKWLERSLAEPANTPEKAAQRLTWIKRTLKAVKRKQAEIKYQTLLMDAYAAHLSAIEMTLISAAEQRTQAGDPNAVNDRAVAGRR
jgi:ABC-type transporter MlaC component